MQINTKLPLGMVFGDFMSSEQDLLVRSMIEEHIGRRHRCFVLYRIWFWFYLWFPYLPCRWWWIRGESILKHYLFFYWYLFLDGVLLVGVSIFESSNLSFIVGPSVHNILLLLVAGTSPSPWPIRLGLLLLNYIITIKMMAYLFRGELEMDLPCSNVYDGLGSWEMVFLEW